MKHLLAFLMLLCSPVLAQVTIKNPDHREVTERNVQILFLTTCRVVSKEFHARVDEFPLVLVLGASNERYTSDEESNVYTIYLDHWNEAQFADSAMRLAIQRLVRRDRRDRMVLEILRRSNQVAPIPLRAMVSRSPS